MSLGPIVVRRTLRLSRDQVWQQIVQPDLRAGWWPHTEIDAVMNGSVSEDSPLTSAVGAVDVLVETQTLGFRWEDAQKGLVTNVMILLRPDDEDMKDTVITVIESGFAGHEDAAELVASHEKAWGERFEVLASASAPESADEGVAVAGAAGAFVASTIDVEEPAETLVFDVDEEAKVSEPEADTEAETDEEPVVTEAEAEHFAVEPEPQPEPEPESEVEAEPDVEDELESESEAVEATEPENEVEAEADSEPLVEEEATENDATEIVTVEDVAEIIEEGEQVFEAEIEPDPAPSFIVEPRNETDAGHEPIILPGPPIFGLQPSDGLETPILLPEGDHDFGDNDLTGEVPITIVDTGGLIINDGDLDHVIEDDGLTEWERLLKGEPLED